MSAASGKRAAPARIDLSDEEISAFCNVLGLAPRQLREARDAVTERYDLGPRGAWMLGLIEVGVSSPSALTESFCIGRSLVTAEINRLTEAGLVSSRQNEQDGRRVELELTAEGRKAAEEVRQAVNQFVTSRLAGHSREEVLSCIALLQDFVGSGKIGEGRREDS